MPLLGLGILKAVGGGIRKLRGSGIVRGFIRDRIKPNGFLSRVMPNFVGGGSNNKSQTRGKEAAPIIPKKEKEPMSKGLIGGIIGGVVLVVGVVIALFKKKNNGQRKRRR